MHTIRHTHASLFVGSYLVVSQIPGIVQRIKIHHSDPSMDRSIKIVEQLEQIFEPYVQGYEWKEKSSSSHHNVSAKDRKTHKKNTRTFFLGRWSIIRGG
jgi:hypothetical protein